MAGLARRGITVTEWGAILYRRLGVPVVYAVSFSILYLWGTTFADLGCLPGSPLTFSLMMTILKLLALPLRSKVTVQLNIILYYSTRTENTKQSQDTLIVLVSG